jgi:hypothetical protein
MPYPPAIYGALTDVYPYTAGQVNGGLPDGLQPGQEYWDPRTANTYMFVVADAAVSQYQAVKTDPGQTTNNWKVIPTATAADVILGVAQQSSGIPSGYAGWVVQYGPATVNVSGAIAAGATLAATATAGALGTPSGTNPQIRAQAVGTTAGAGTLLANLL